MVGEEMTRPTFKTELERQLWLAIQAAGIPHSNLARMSGVNPTLLCNWVRGRRWLSTRAVDAIAQTLDLVLVPRQALRPGQPKRPAQPKRKSDKRRGSHGKSVQ